MNAHRGFALIMFLLITSLSVLSQERIVYGRVTAFGTYGLNKVEVKAKKSGEEALSEEDGTYSIVCSGDDKLIFEAKGFFRRLLKVGQYASGDSVNVNLLLKSGEKNISVATGYGHIEKDKLTHAIENVESENDFSEYNSVLDIIRGKFSGVAVAENYISIRGQNTFGEDAALLVVDGVIVDMAIVKNLAVSQIKSINILKGASASSRYGSRGMNGVVVIKTKSKN